ncbi:condensation domain-containing protein, partial [Rhodococcus yananensis]
VGLAARLESRAGDGGRVALVAQPRPERVPLSPAQQRMWFLNRLESASAAYNIPAALKLSGTLDTDAMRAAVRDVVGRHEVLRTVYPETDGVGYQKVLPISDAVIDLPVVDTAADAVQDTVDEFFATQFDVTRDVPIRARLLRVASTEYVLMFVVHHIAADGFSMAPLTRDVMIAYEARVRGAAPAWVPLDVQYADYAIWQRRVLGDETDPGSVMSRQLDYWRAALGASAGPLELPTDRPRPAVASGRGAVHRFVVPGEVVARVRKTAAAHRVTEFMVVHAASAVLLARLSNTDDVTIGTPVAGRGEAALDDLVGMFVNTLVLRTRVDPGESFAELFARVREADLGAFGNADVPFERLVEVLDPPRSQAHHPLFQVMLTFQNLDGGSFELPGLTVDSLDSTRVATRADLQFTFSHHVDAETGLDALDGEFAYATDLFDESTVIGFAERFVRVLSAVTDPAATVGDVELLAPAEREAVLTNWNATDRAVTAGTLPSAFDEQVQRSPEAPAVVSDDRSLSYSEFASRVNRLARHLIAVGVGPESTVALGMRRSVDLVVAMYAVLAAGGGYVPVDPDQPADRNGYVLDVAEPAVVLTTDRDGFDVASEKPVPVLAVDTVDLSAYSDAPVTDADRISPLRPSNTAYVIFTSGSTGRPKGVAVSHGAIVNRLLWMQAE